MAQVFNPYLPSWEYVPDGEPHVFGDRVYVYGSHDRFNGISFCLNDYVCWSAPLSDLSAWRFEGVIFKKKQDLKCGRGFVNSLYAPDVCQGADGRFYLYYFIGYTGRIGVAVCDSPAGKYEFFGYVRYADSTLVGSRKEPLQFDPGVLADDGKFYLYTGFGPDKYPRFLMGGHCATKEGAMGFELDSDMLTVKGDMHYIGVPSKAAGKGTPFEGHEFFEAASMRKFGGKYYFIYSSYLGHELCYAVSDNPLSGFKFGGTLVSIGDIGLREHTCPKNAANFTGNTHGSIEKLNGEYYVFYHRQTNRHQFSRQACAERLTVNADGSFNQAEVTSCGLNGGALSGIGEYEARIACNLYSKKGARFYGVLKGGKRKEPYFTQSGGDREYNPDQYIAAFQDGCVVGFKYFKGGEAGTVSVTVKGKAKGKLLVSLAENGPPAAVIDIMPSTKREVFSAPASLPKGESFALFFRYEGKGAFDFYSFRLQ